MRLDRRRGNTGGMTPIRRALLFALAVVSVLVLAQCSDKSDDAKSSTSATGSPKSTTETFGGTPTTGVTPSTLVGNGAGGPGAGQGGEVVNVLARTEVKRTARELAKAFSEANPTYRVVLTLDTGVGISARLRSGETPDIVLENRKRLAASSEENLVVWRPIEFATQVPVIVVALGNPKGVRSLSSFGPDGSSISAVCAPDRNCGKVANILFHRAGINAAPDRVFPGASAVVNAIKAGEVDVSILDGPKAANRSTIVEPLPIPSSVNLINTHWQMSSATGNAGADAFSGFLFSTAGVSIVANRGLLPPTT